MGFPQLHFAKGEVQAPFPGQRKAVGDVQVVRLHPQKTCYQGPVRAVPSSGFGKGAVEQQLGLHRLIAQKGTGDVADPHCTGRV